MKPVLNPRKDLKRPVMPQQVKLLAMLSDGPLTALQAYEDMKDIADTKETVRQVLCQMVYRGYAKKLGKHECETCHHPSMRYEITALGRRYLDDYTN